MIYVFYVLCYVLCYLLFGIFVITSVEAYNKATDETWKAQEDVGTYMFGACIWPIVIVICIAEAYFNWLVKKLKKEDK